MSTVYNIRGTNGSGKTTLARAFLPAAGGRVDLNWYDSPTKRDPSRRLRVPGYINSIPGDRVGLIGSYATPTGGLDTVPSFPIQQAAIAYMLENLKVEHVIAEGILSSTVFGSWADFDLSLMDLGRHHFAWVYLQTPIELCLERIAARQRAAGRERPIKEELVRDKVKAVAATRTKALAAGRLVYDLPVGGEENALRAIMRGEGEVWRGQ